MRSPSKTQKTKFFRIWSFVLLLLVKYPFAKPAYAALSTVDTCLQQPQCAGAIAGELSPAVSAPTGVGYGASILSTTSTTTNAVKAAAGVVIVVAGVTAVGVTYHYWDQAHNQTAQEEAKRKYCATYPTDIVCPKVGEPYYIWFHNSAKQPQYLCVLSHTWGAAVVGSSPYLMGYVELTDILNQYYSYSYFTEDVYWGKGVNTPFNSSPPTCSFSPAPAWEAWPQAKRDIAVGMLNQSDWSRFIDSMPSGLTLQPGDTLRDNSFLKEILE